ncbi:dihydropteroate synthase [Candidatus Peribacteria bacterium]|jgi:dihydropteroate synthase|nr:dihydropteroate synthase [Candidatus Peribacteria bacterium]MBT4021233.1 dihydropteroate synthase [Candidatus Peribacteria bacterium]MBT4240691.1 dihydropteroate synthase [Candidatus Peribacteria bacterium]MBT4473944.1 dihydropteroate synthase [Candidatus Peribacteria bacterium]
MQNIQIMGILNVTPDSFYDGGKYNDLENATVRIEEMCEQGANIVDIGGESTGPGSEDISAEEEMGRVIPVIRKVVSGEWLVVSDEKEEDTKQEKKIEENHINVSVDTYKSEVARAAIELGVEIINDVTAGRGDEKMFKLIAETGCKYILMHSKDNSPRTTIQQLEYEDVLETIHEFFEDRIREAENSGIKKEQMILDPGLGHFVSSDPKYSWEILNNLEFLHDFGCPILVSPSRKSFTEKTLEGTLEATKIAVEHGANIIRTHDVLETKKLIDKIFN